MEIDILCEAVRNQRVIWDRLHPQHYDRTVVAQAWKHIATKMGASELEVRKKYKNLRDTFTKELRKVHDHRQVAADIPIDAYASKWPVFPLLFFLRDTIIKRRPAGLGSDVMEFTDCLDEDDDSGDDDDDEEEFDAMTKRPSEMLSVDMDAEPPNPMDFLDTSNPTPSSSAAANIAAGKTAAKFTNKPTNTNPLTSNPGTLSDGPPTTSSSVRGVSGGGQLSGPRELNIAVAPRRKRTKQSFQEEFLTLEHAKLDMLRKASKDENDDTRQFLLSLVANVKKMTAQQELEFRIGVQTLIRDYAYPSKAAERKSAYNNNNFNKSSPDNFRSVQVGGNPSQGQMEKNISMDNRPRTTATMDSSHRAVSTVSMDISRPNRVAMDVVSRASVAMDNTPMDNFPRAGLAFDTQNRSNITMDNHFRTIGQQQDNRNPVANVPVSQMHAWSRLMPL